jgi:hypothetical protein
MWRSLKGGACGNPTMQRSANSRFKSCSLAPGPRCGGSPLGHTTGGLRGSAYGWPSLGNRSVADWQRNLLENSGPSRISRLWRRRYGSWRG